LPDLLRRVAALTIVAAVAIALLAPLTTRSATPLSAESLRLLAVVDRPMSLADRAAAEGREHSARLSLAAVAPPIGPESLSGTGLAAPPAAPMEATLYRIRTAAPSLSGDSISGKATWYCCSAGWRGLAVVALPGALGGHYDAPPASKSVTVCGTRCVLLPVVDYCGCYWGTSSQRVADLSPEAWAAVTDAPLSRGVVTVTVYLGG
jgi:hypothetical protein